MTTQELQAAHKLIPVLHSTYCYHTGLSLILSTSRLFRWEVWCSRGWTEADLILVIKRVKELIRDNRKWLSALHFRRLIEDTEAFEELLGEARAIARNSKPRTARQSVLASTGRRQSEPTNCKTAAQIMADSEALAKFKAWRKEAGL